MSAQSDDPLATCEHVTVDDTTDPGSVFRALLPFVCKNCFTILKRREYVPNRAGDRYHDLLAAVKYHLPEDYRFDLLDREYHEVVGIDQRYTETAPPLERTPTVGTSRGCRTCGVCSPHRSPDGTRSKDELTAAAGQLSATLEELAIPHDRHVLVATARRLKSDPDRSGKEHDILAAATAAAITHHSDTES